MSNEITIPPNFGAVSSRFAGRKIESDLGGGISLGYGIVGYRGKVWSVRYQGKEIPLMREDGDGPRNSIEVVIVAAGSGISKVYYPKFDPTSKAPPVCFSNDGIRPDKSVTNPVKAICTDCPNNVFGTRVTDNGSKGKACSDYKRLAVVPWPDIRNEAWGGPMLLRVPGASLKPLKLYAEELKRIGCPDYGLVTKVSFAPDKPHPEMVFAPLRPLTDPEIDVIEEMQRDPRVKRIVSEAAEHVLEAAQPAPTNVVPLRPPVTPAVTSPVTALDSAKANAKFESDLDAELDDLLPPG